MITLNLERYDWECGDGCCSSSGAVVEVINTITNKNTIYGNEENSTIESDVELYINALNAHFKD